MTLFDRTKSDVDREPMKTRTKRILAAVLVATVLCCSLVTWGVVRAVAWARDLPNRVVIDGDAIADAFSSAVVQSYHQVLTGGDAETQRKVMRDFSNFIADDAAARSWVGNEYADDLKRLTSSSNAEVSADAAKLLADLADVRGDGDG